jgi:hypothetical protein
MGKAHYCRRSQFRRMDARWKYSTRDIPRASSGPADEVGATRGSHSDGLIDSLAARTSLGKLWATHVHIDRPNCELEWRRAEFPVGTEC